MTVWDFVNQNPGWTLLYLVVISITVEIIAEAIVKAVRRRNDKGDVK